MSIRFVAALGLLTFALHGHALAETRVSVMQFNAENLFDTVDDANRDDETYLPLAYKKAHRDVLAKCDKQSNENFKRDCREYDWSESVFETKISRVASVIRSVNNGRGPDIQVLVEIENINALRLLRDRKLADLGYKTMELIEGPDTRGIDNAVLSRFPMWDKTQLHIIPFKDKNGNPDKTGSRSRGILEVRLLLPDGQKVAVFACHFPSMSNPTYLRKQAVAELNRLKSQLPAGVLAIAAGDFNISAEEDSQAHYITRDLADQWAVSHLIGCRNCRGTEVYHGEWSFLDVVSFSPEMNNKKSPWQIDVASIEVPHTVKEHVLPNGEPARFLPPNEGISDHWPLYVEIVKK
jgi:endonuclease/exonuclease/phosphatase family metal-dependent hydrolase